MIANGPACPRCGWANNTIRRLCRNCRCDLVMHPEHEIDHEVRMDADDGRVAEAAASGAAPSMVEQASSGSSIDLTKLIAVLESSICGLYITDHMYQELASAVDDVVESSPEVAALQAERDHLAKCMEVAGLQCFMKHERADVVAGHMAVVAKAWRDEVAALQARVAELEAARDAALARVAELEAALRDYCEVVP